MNRLVSNSDNTSKKQWMDLGCFKHLGSNSTDYDCLHLCVSLTVGMKDTDKEAAGMLTWNVKTGDGGLPPLIQMSNGKWRVDFESLRQ